MARSAAQMLAVGSVALVLAAAGGCSAETPEQPGAMPDLLGQPLQKAYTSLEGVNAQFDTTVYLDDNDDVGRFVVCQRSPQPGEPAVDVRLRVAHSWDKCLKKFKSS